MSQQTAIERYYQNPNICFYCEEVIHVTDGRVHNARRKKFCSCSCAASYNNFKVPKRKARMSGPCKLCGAEVPYTKYKKGWYRRPYCDTCLKVKRTRGAEVGEQTKQELFSRRKSWQSARAAIQKHAAAIFFDSNQKKACAICGYDKHVEVAHIHPVSEFPAETKVKQINRIENLVGLCPNHHWEHDHGLLKLGGVAGEGFEPSAHGL